MRRVRVLAGVGAALLLAGCSDQPNDLRDNRYYQDPEPPSSSAPPAQTDSPRPAAAPAPATIPATTTRRSAPAADQFALAAKDLTAEGVQLAGTSRTIPSALPDCDASLGTPAAAYQSTWSYPTGSTLRQYLAVYDGSAATAAAKVREALGCGQVSTPVVAEDGQVSWCATTSRQAACSVLRSTGSALSIVTVTATTESKAKPAVTRIAPLAATALARNS